MLESKSRTAWSKVTDLNLNFELSLGLNYTELLLRDPKRLGFVLSRYKFAAKMLKSCKQIVEIGCGEGIGSLILLSETKADFLGIDFDEKQIAYACDVLLPNVSKTQPEWGNRARYECRDLTSSPLTRLADGIVSLDVIEHVDKSEEDIFMANMVNAI